jgi:hypothetical protein
MINKDFARKFIDELRSEKYTQIFGGYYDNKGGFCELGLAAKVAGLEKNILRYNYWWNGSIGLSSDQLDIILHMNDKEKKTFNEIADYMESLLNDRDSSRM